MGEIKADNESEKSTVTKRYTNQTIIIENKEKNEYLMETIATYKKVKKIIDDKIGNYNCHKESIKNTIKDIEEKLKELSSISEKPAELDNDKRKKVINELLDKGVIKFFFCTNAHSYNTILEEIKRIVNEQLPQPINHEINKFHSVIWLRDTERHAETYSFYNSKNDEVTLYAKAGLNQRSYQLWANGNRDGDYVDVYYNHLINMQDHSFFPHNDRRFCQTTSDYLHDNPDAGEYLRSREEVWKKIYNANIGINPYLIEKIFAFGYVQKEIASGNNIDLQIDSTAGNFSVKLVCNIKLDEGELRKVLSKYGSFTVSGGFDLNAQIGDAFVLETGSKTLAAGVNAFYKLKDVIESKNAQTIISEQLKSNGALVTSDLSEEILFRVFLDMLLYKIDLKINSLAEIAEIVKIQDKIKLKVKKLNTEVERLKKAELDLNKEAIIINRMNYQLKEWYDSMNTKMACMRDVKAESETLDARDL